MTKHSTTLTNEDIAALRFRSMNGRRVGRDQFAGNNGDSRDFNIVLAREIQHRCWAGLYEFPSQWVNRRAYAEACAAVRVVG